jgi:hypothetical protein
MIALFKYPTIRDLARHLGGVETNQAGKHDSTGQTVTRTSQRSGEATRRDLRRAGREGGAGE